MDGDRGSSSIQLDWNTAPAYCELCDEFELGAAVRVMDVTISIRMSAYNQVRPGHCIAIHNTASSWEILYIEYN